MPLARKIKPHSQSHASGFTLVEVLVTIILLALVIIPLLRIQVNLFRRQLRTYHTNTATLYAQSNIELASTYLQYYSKNDDWENTNVANNSGSCGSDTIRSLLEIDDQNIRTNASSNNSINVAVHDQANALGNCYFQLIDANQPVEKTFEGTDNTIYKGIVSLNTICRNSNTLEIIESCGDNTFIDPYTIEVVSVVMWDEPGVDPALSSLNEPRNPVRVELRTLVTDTNE